MLENVSFDWSLTISIIALIASILSPVITVTVNLRHQRTLRRLDELREHERRRINAIESFLKNAGAMLYGREDEWRRIYSQSLYNVFLYLPECYWDDIKKLDYFISKFDEDNARPLLFSLATKLSESYPRLKEDHSDDYMRTYVQRINKKSAP